MNAKDAYTMVRKRWQPSKKRYLVTNPRQYEELRDSIIYLFEENAKCYLRLIHKGYE